MDQIALKAPAKINLTFEIEDKLDNGYHLVKSVMQTVNLYDTIKIKKSNTRKINISCNDPDIPTDNSNTASKACQLFYQASELPFYGIDITIEKTIPSQAGLAGGSSDAAAVLLGLNAIYDNILESSEINALSVEIGADVTFMLEGGTAFATGIGEVIMRLHPLPNCYIVIVKPEACVSTQQAYQLYDDVGVSVHPDSETLIAAIASSDLQEIASLLCNEFECVVNIPQRNHILDIMNHNDCLGASMTGSGSSFFAIFDNKSKAKKCRAELLEHYNHVFLTKPVNHGIIIE